MKVLLVILGAYSKIGGMERFNQRLIRALAELKGSKIRSGTVLSLWDTREDCKFVPKGIDFIPCGSSKIKFLLQYISLILRHHYKVILYAHLFLSPLAILALPLRAKRALIVYGFEAWDKKFTPPGYRPPNLVEVLAVKRLISHIISISRFTANQMSITYRINHDKFHLLPSGIDFSNDINQNSTPGAKEYILTVCRLDEYKGVDKVILAMPAILRSFPSLHYYVVGDGPLRQKLEISAREASVGERVIFWGRVGDNRLREIYSQAKIFVMPSKGEGFGIVFLEAWLHKIPVIAGNQDASSEVITNGFNGIIVDPDSPEQIAEAIIRLLSDPHSAKKMGENGYQTVLAKYTHEKFRENLANVLVKIVA